LYSQSWRGQTLTAEVAIYVILQIGLGAPFSGQLLGGIISGFVLDDCRLTNGLTGSLTYDHLVLRTGVKINRHSAERPGSPQSQPVVCVAFQSLPDEPAITGGTAAIVIILIADRAVVAVAVAHGVSGPILSIPWIVVVISLPVPMAWTTIEACLHARHC
jgi:hypothetical protein